MDPKTAAETKPEGRVGKIIRISIGVIGAGIFIALIIGLIVNRR